MEEEVTPESLSHSTHRHFFPMLDDIVIDKFDQTTMHRDAIHRNEYRMFYVLAKLIEISNSK